MNVEVRQTDPDAAADDELQVKGAIWHTRRFVLKGRSLMRYQGGVCKGISFVMSNTTAVEVAGDSGLDILVTGLSCDYERPAPPPLMLRACSLQQRAIWIDAFKKAAAGVPKEEEIPPGAPLPPSSLHAAFSSKMQPRADELSAADPNLLFSSLLTRAEALWNNKSAWKQVHVHFVHSELSSFTLTKCTATGEGEPAAAGCEGVFPIGLRECVCQMVENMPSNSPKWDSTCISVRVLHRWSEKDFLYHYIIDPGAGLQCRDMVYYEGWRDRDGCVVNVGASMFESCVPALPNSIRMRLSLHYKLFTPLDDGRTLYNAFQMCQLKGWLPDWLTVGGVSDGLWKEYVGYFRIMMGVPPHEWRETRRASVQSRMLSFDSGRIGRSSEDRLNDISDMLSERSGRSSRNSVEDDDIASHRQLQQQQQQQQQPPPPPPQQQQ